jgi:hypothetical protein
VVRPLVPFQIYVPNEDGIILFRRKWPPLKPALTSRHELSQKGHFIGFFKRLCQHTYDLISNTKFDKWARSYAQNGYITSYQKPEAPGLQNSWFKRQLVLPILSVIFGNLSSPRGHLPLWKNSIAKLLPGGTERHIPAPGPEAIIIKNRRCPEGHLSRSASCSPEAAI